MDKLPVIIVTIMVLVLVVTVLVMVRCVASFRDVTREVIKVVVMRRKMG